MNNSDLARIIKKIFESQMLPLNYYTYVNNIQLRTPCIIHSKQKNKPTRLKTTNHTLLVLTSYPNRIDNRDTTSSYLPC